MGYDDGEDESTFKKISRYQAYVSVTVGFVGFVLACITLNLNNGSEKCQGFDTTDFKTCMEENAEICQVELEECSPDFENACLCKSLFSAILTPTALEVSMWSFFLFGLIPVGVAYWCGVEKAFRNYFVYVFGFLKQFLNLAAAVFFLKETSGQSCSKECGQGLEATNITTALVYTCVGELGLDVVILLAGLMIKWGFCFSGVYDMLYRFFAYLDCCSSYDYCLSCDACYPLM